MKTKIYIPDIECESCSKLIKKKISIMDGINEYNLYPDSLDIDYDKEIIKAEDVISIIEDLGFRASIKPFERKSFSERWKDFIENKHKYYMIYKTIKYAVLTFIILVLFQALAFLGFLNSMIPNFISHYAWWLIYLDLSVATIGATLWYMSSYKGTVTCMTGMMIGMTVGMQAGMMIGAVVGGTNGFFTGAMVGMTVAVIAGTLTGAVCGIMGAVQGMMSGVMAGTMGSMITVMMFTDNVIIFMPYYMTINVLILLGLIYLFYEEVVEGKKDVKKKSLDFITFVSACVIVTAIITLIIIYGPKSPLFA
jgi:copper chaperone CopZ